MSLDITFKETRPKLCPHCGKVVEIETIATEGSGGREWYPILESLGYYVPYDKRTEENDWYAKDMILSPEQAKEVYDYIKERVWHMYSGNDILGLIARATFDGHGIVINADW